MSQTTHPDPASSRHDAPVSAGLTIGFAIGACLWTLGYLLHFPGLSTPPIVVGLLLLVVQAVGSALAGMWGPSRAKLRLGLTTGLTMGLVNLLVLGSLLFESSGETTQARPAAGVIVLGWLAYSLVLGVVGVWIGGAVSPGGGGRDQSAPAWRARFGVLAALTMLPLLFVGGVVTTSDSGMAVPDWPNTFGSNMFLFPLSKMTGGVYFEHTHRLFGVLEGLTVLTLMALTIRGGGALAKKLAVIAFVLIAIQGGLGGIRVTESSRVLALFHGVAAQGIFAALLAVLAAVLSPGWNDGHAATPAPRVRKLVRLCWVTLGIVLVQIALGGMIRHFSGATLSMHSALTHAGWALVVAAHVFMLGSRIGAMPEAPRRLKRIALTNMSLVGVQLLLGMIALGIAMMHQNRAEAPPVRLFVAATHQTVGAILFGGVALSLAWAKRSLIDAGGSDA